MIFIDRSIPKRVATALQQVRRDVLWLEDRFAHGTPDVQWLTVAGANHWLVISRDKRIRHRPAERQTIIDSGVGCFILAQRQNPTVWQYLKLIALTLDEMERRFATTPRPFIYTVNSAGQFRLVQL